MQKKKGLDSGLEWEIWLIFKKVQNTDFLRFRKENLQMNDFEGKLLEARKAENTSRGIS